MLEDPRLDRNKIRVPRRDNYEKRPVLSATIHPDIKRTLVVMSERTGMTVSQVTDEVLYAGLIGMQEMDQPEGQTPICTQALPLIHETPADRSTCKAEFRWRTTESALRFKSGDIYEKNTGAMKARPLTCTPPAPESLLQVDPTGT